MSGERKEFLKLVNKEVSVDSDTNGIHPRLYLLYLDLHLRTTIYFPFLIFQIELYNSMVDKEGKGEAEAQKAYKAARKANEDGTERDPVTSALIDRVTQGFPKFFSFLNHGYFFKLLWLFYDLEL